MILTKKISKRAPADSSLFYQGVSTSGFVLIEIVLALALFAMVAVAMVSALNQIGQTSTGARRECQVLRVLQSVLAEVSHQPELKETTIEFPISPDGVNATASVVKAELVTQEKVALDKMFLVSAEAWMDDPYLGTINRRLEVYVYTPAKK